MTYDCIVIGGGAAGLSAALVLGRARKRTLLVDAGEPSNLPAHAIGGLLGQDGRSPADFYAQGRAQLEPHTTVELRDGAVTAAHRTNGHFTLELASGETHTARRIVLATGMEYRRPQIPGLEPLWGDSVFHCPFCHGWEVRDQPIAVLAGGEQADHLLHMLPNWSDDVVLVDPDRPIARLVAEDGKLAAIEFEDGETLPRTALLVAVTFHQRSDLHEQLGARTTERGFLEVDAMLATTAPGVYAAGDLTGQPQSVANAIASGFMAAAMVVREG
jgi:thioredoxin reductase